MDEEEEQLDMDMELTPTTATSSRGPSFDARRGSKFGRERREDTDRQRDQDQDVEKVGDATGLALPELKVCDEVGLGLSGSTMDLDLESPATVVGDPTVTHIPFVSLKRDSNHNHTTDNSSRTLSSSLLPVPVSPPPTPQRTDLPSLHIHPP